MNRVLTILLLCTGLLACNNEKKGAPATATSANTLTSSPDLKAPDVAPSSNGITETITVVDSITGKASKAEKPLRAISSGIGPNPIVQKSATPPTVVALQPKTPQEQKVVRVLTNNYWIIQALVRIKDKDASRQNPGAWFKFKPDGSYDYGYMENKIGSGAWSFDGKKALVHLDSEVEGDDREWSVKISRDEDIMICVGTERYHTTGINMKMINLMFIPKNRKEIGLDW